MSTLACGVSDYTQGIVSTVSFGDTPPYNIAAVTQLPAPTNLSGDPRVLAFKHNGDDRVLVASYRYPSGPGVPGEADFGIYIPSATTNWGAPIATATTSGGVNNWGVSNPRGIITIGEFMYISDYDTNDIAIIDMTGDAYTLAATISNVFTTTGGNTAHGEGLDMYAFAAGSPAVTYHVLVALYSQETSLAYGPSGLVLIAVNDASYNIITKTQLSGLTENAVSLRVNDEDGDFYAYVCAMGDLQVADGNWDKSTVQVISLPTGITPGIPLPTYNPAPAIEQTIHATAETPPPSTPPSLFGDFNDLEFWEGNAYILAANWNEFYTEYKYQLIRTSTANLHAGQFTDGGDPSSDTDQLISSPAGATWMLAPASDTLWLVAGNNVLNVPSGTLTPYDPVLNPTPLGPVVADATNGVSSGVGLGNATVNGNLNTASVVIDLTALAARAGATVSVSRTKVALNIEDLKRRRAKK